MANPIDEDTDHVVASVIMIAMAMTSCRRSFHITNTDHKKKNILQSKTHPSKNKPSIFISLHVVFGAGLGTHCNMYVLFLIFKLHGIQHTAFRI